MHLNEMLMSILMMKRQGTRALSAPIDIEEMTQATAAKSLGVLVWPLGIAATAFLFAATMTVFIVWIPVIVLFALSTDVFRRKHMDARKGLTCSS
jgi:hypothetical protein